jgi:hypothetical protein
MLIIIIIHFEIIKQRHKDYFREVIEVIKEKAAKELLIASSQ